MYNKRKIFTERTEFSNAQFYKRIVIAGCDNYCSFAKIKFVNYRDLISKFPGKRDKFIKKRLPTDLKMRDLSAFMSDLF
jgi:hypothetical protein